MFAAACPRSNRMDSGASGARGSGVTRAIAHGRAGEMPGPRTERRQLAQVRPVATDDERPALEVLAAAGVTAGAQDPVEVLGRERFRRERADRPLRARWHARRRRRRRRSSAGRRDGSRFVRPRERRRWSRRSRSADGSPRARRRGPASGCRSVTRRSPRTGPRRRGSAPRAWPPRSHRRRRDRAGRRTPRSGSAPPPGGRSGPRRARNADRRRSAGSRPARHQDRRGATRSAARASRSRWLDGMTASSSPWASRIGPR